ncbi:MAG TPA: kelch repeat-containing protein [Anaeromyxobacteraceae bacterium]|nr:kelch repeat-containing protein [Anaeromyxobacteraceae bacterium]
MAVVFAALMGGCGGGDDAGPREAPGASIRLEPAEVQVLVGGSVWLAPVVTGTDETEVTFAVEEAGGGTVFPSGEYVAPGAPGTFHVVARLAADPARAARATIHVTGYAGVFERTRTDPVVAQTGHAAALLADRSILLVGGPGPDLTAAQRYDPRADRFEAAGRISTKRARPAVAALADGRVLVTGGETSGSFSVSAVSRTAELFEPFAGPFELLAGELTLPRAHHTATELDDGDVLVVGGSASLDGTVPATATAERWDRATRTFAATGSLGAARQDHTATRLPDGRVLVLGGRAATCRTGGVCGAAIASAEIWDPETGTFEPLGALATPRYGHTATLLPDGRLLVAGGWFTSGNGVSEEVGTYELFDPATGAAELAGDMRFARALHTATLLHDGRVLVAGGGVALVATDRTELFDPAGPGVAEGPALSSPRMSHTATLLPDGRVLVVGGTDASALATAETFR